MHKKRRCSAQCSRQWWMWLSTNKKSQKHIIKVPLKILKKLYCFVSLSHYWVKIFPLSHRSNFAKANAFEIIGVNCCLTLCVCVCVCGSERATVHCLTSEGLVMQHTSHLTHYMTLVRCFFFFSGLDSLWSPDAFKRAPWIILSST